MVIDSEYSITEYPDCFCPPDYCLRMDVPSDTRLYRNGFPHYYDYYDPLMHKAVVHLDLSESVESNAIREHELTHLSLIEISLFGLFIRACLDFANFTNSSELQRLFLDIAKILHNASILVQESAATFCEIETLRLEQNLSEVEVLDYIESELPRFYRRMYSITRVVVQNTSIPTRSEILERETSGLIPFANPMRMKIYIAALFAGERRWRYWAVRHMASIALNPHLLGILSSRKLSSLRWLKIKLLRATHAPSRRYRALFRLLRDDAVLEKLQEYYKDRIRRWALRLAEESGPNLEKPIAPTLAIVQEVSVAEIANLLEVQLGVTGLPLS